MDGLCDEMDLFDYAHNIEPVRSFLTLARLEPCCVYVHVKMRTLHGKFRA